MTNRGVQAANAGADIVSLAPTREAVYGRGDTDSPYVLGQRTCWLRERCSRPWRRLRRPECSAAKGFQWLSPQRPFQRTSPDRRVVMADDRRLGILARLAAGQATGKG